MQLNTLRPAPGSKTPAKRVDAVLAQEKVKTCGRGHKGQRARAGGFHKVGFEAVRCLYKDEFLNQVFVPVKRYCAKKKFVYPIDKPLLKLLI